MLKGPALTWIIVGLLVTGLVIGTIAYLLRLAPGYGIDITRVKELTFQSEADSTPNPNLVTFEMDGFSFQHLSAYSIQSQSETEVTWQLQYTSTSLVSNQLTLRKQDKPFTDLAEGSIFVVAGEPKVVEKVNEKNVVRLDLKIAQRYKVTCGLNCSYQIVRFDHNGKYYELIQSTAAAGLERGFQELIKSFKFNNG